MTAEQLLRKAIEFYWEAGDSGVEICGRDPALGRTQYILTNPQITHAECEHVDDFQAFVFAEYEREIHQKLNDIAFGKEKGGN